MARKLLLLLGAMWMYNANAQRLSPEIVSSVGATYQGASMQIDWTLGELAVTTLQNSTQQVTQGFHQPVYSVTSIHELTVEAGQIKVYPNPASDFVNIEIEPEYLGKTELTLYSMQGQRLYRQSINQITERMSIRHLPPGTYILMVKHADGRRLSQRIVKY